MLLLFCKWTHCLSVRDIWQSRWLKSAKMFIVFLTVVSVLCCRSPPCVKRDYVLILCSQKSIHAPHLHVPFTRFPSSWIPCRSSVTIHHQSGCCWPVTYTVLSHNVHNQMSLSQFCSSGEYASISFSRLLLIKIQFSPYQHTVPIPLWSSMFLFLFLFFLLICCKYTK